MNKIFHPAPMLFLWLASSLLYWFFISPFGVYTFMMGEHGGNLLFFVLGILILIFPLILLLFLEMAKRKEIKSLICAALIMPPVISVIALLAFVF